MLTTLLTQELVSLLFLGFFALQLLDPSAVFCRRSIHLLLSFRPQNYCRGKTLTIYNMAQVTLPCEQRLHFRGMSWRAKSSLGYFSRATRNVVDAKFQGE